MGKTTPHFEYVIQWERDEHNYADSKVTQNEEEDDQRTIREPEYWEDQIGMYVHRSCVLGLDTPAGRQAAFKALATALSFAESVVRVYGAVPEPGVPSGYNLGKLRELPE